MSLRRDLAGLPKELQLAAVAAAALGLSELLPWYQKSYFQAGQVVQGNVSAFGVFTFVEAAVLLVAFAVLFLIWARSQRRAFHLPGGDGVAITLAGAWAVLLVIWRLFDKPGIQGAGATMGIQWGIFGALFAAGALIVAGARVRAAKRPEPPNPVADEVDWVAAPRRERGRHADRRPRDSSAVTEALRDRPAWEGEAREAPVDRSRDRTTRLDDDAREGPVDRSRDRTTRLDDEEPTTRLPDDRGGERTRRLGDEPTTRLRDEPSLFDDPSGAPTTRLPGEEPRRRRTDDDVPPS
jgi:hypothetical protein